MGEPGALRMRRIAPARRAASSGVGLMPSPGRMGPAAGQRAAELVTGGSRCPGSQRERDRGEMWHMLDPDPQGPAGRMGAALVRRGKGRPVNGLPGPCAGGGWHPSFLTWPAGVRGRLRGLFGSFCLPEMYLLPFFFRFPSNESLTRNQLGFPSLPEHITGLHRLHRRPCDLPPPHRWTVPEEALPQGLLPHRRAPRLLPHEEGPQRRKEAHGRPHRPAHPGDYPPPHRPEPHPGRRRCHHQLRTQGGLHPRRRRRRRPSPGRRHVPLPQGQLRPLPPRHRRQGGLFPQPQDYGRVPGRGAHQRCSRFVELVCHQEEGRDRARRQVQPLRNGLGSWVRRALPPVSVPCGCERTRTRMGGGTHPAGPV